LKARRLVSETLSSSSANDGSASGDVAISEHFTDLVDLPLKVMQGFAAEDGFDKLGEIGRTRQRH
jgi:hypothetical protein